MQITSNPGGLPRRIAAFTLVELLVTITIIIAIASLTLMGISKLRAAANRSLSLGNLSQLQIASASFATESNGRFMATYSQDANGKTSDWVRNSAFLDAYLADTSISANVSASDRVPVPMLDPTAYRAKKASYDKLWASYGMVSRIGYSSAGKSVDSSYALHELTQPHRTASFTTAVNWLVQYGGRFSWVGVEGKVNAPAIAYRYGNKALVVYYDGHIGEVSMADIRSFDQQGGASHPFWNGTAK